MDSSLNPMQIYVVSFVEQSFPGKIICAVHNNYTIVTFVYQKGACFSISLMFVVIIFSINPYLCCGQQKGIYTNGTNIQ